MKNNFVHLHTHSHYSLLDGLSQIDPLVKQAVKFEMPALALTDHGNLYGAIEFYKACKKAGIKPIIGIEGYVANRARFNKEPHVDNKRYHLTLLAKNLKGYKNLIKLVTSSHLEGFYYRPRMDIDLLREYHDGLICLSGCFGSELARALRSKNFEEAERVALFYQNIFGKENYFLEIMHHPGIEGLLNVKNYTIELARRLKIPLAATQDSHYLESDDKKAHETLLAVQTQGDMSEETRFSMAEGDFSFISGEEAAEKFADVPEAIENTMRVAEICDLELKLGSWVFPNFQTENGLSHDQMLSKITEKGLQKFGLANNNETKKRIDYELDIIAKKGFAPYFLVVSDLLRFAHENNILTTTRGSAAGSIVAYLTDITNVDPIAYQLPFERFLNPFRPSAPDIDMDFADNRRDEVIEYVKKKYGADKVAQIGTFGTMLARGVVRDVARALGRPYAFGDKISRLIPFGSQGFPMTIDHAFELEPELKQLYENDQAAREVIDLGKKLEGCARHVSVHAAGVVISPTALTDFTPLQHDPKGGKMITQYDMYTIDDVGLLKLDFLGIKNLSILADSVSLVEKHRNKKVDIENVPVDDKTTYGALAKGETMGLFQLGGSGMTRYLIDLKPSSIHDINVMVALYRPGPMENINEYIARKHGKRPVEYFHPKAHKFLERSFGILVYQDDLLLTAVELAGYDWEAVDKFRKAVGKKIPEEMAKQHEIFVEGCIRHSGMNKNRAEEIWQLFEPFQGYGFNKAHAASYGKVAYQTAYMKANFPVEYMTAVLSADSGDVEKIAEIITECKRMNIPVLPPDINESFIGFTIVNGSTKITVEDENVTIDQEENTGNKIRFGLYTIKNFGEGIADSIIKEREAGGKFKTLSDFLERIQDRNLNKKSLEALTMSGAMDNFGERGQMLANTERLLNYNRDTRSASLSMQNSLFAMMRSDATIPGLRLEPKEPATQADKLRWEKELLGLYISGHPLDNHKEKLAARKTTIQSVKETLKDGMQGVIAGLVEEVRPVLTKRGQKMLFAKIADFTDRMEVVLFPSSLAAYHEMLQPEKCVAIKGRVSLRNGEKSLVVEAVKEL